MSKFNTHGGYFAPQGYLRINTGGTHEQNPNGGVQLGVDTQGVPNMVEQNETVYKDFVFSDNIKASADMIAKHHLPKNLIGKLYSEIADYFIAEAEERPNDAASNKGLNAMLARAAQAQEEQKQIEQQAAIEKELSQMSPEELDELAQIVAAGPDAQVQPLAQPEEQAPVQTPMMPMANGGLLHTYKDGGDKKSNWFTKMTLGAAMAEDPAVMQASGWESTPEGVVMGDPNSEGATALREGLDALSYMSPTGGVMHGLYDTGEAIAEGNAAGAAVNAALLGFGVKPKNASTLLKTLEKEASVAAGKSQAFKTATDALASAKGSVTSLEKTLQSSRNMVETLTKNIEGITDSLRDLINQRQSTTNAKQLKKIGKEITKLSTEYDAAVERLVKERVAVSNGEKALAKAQKAVNTAEKTRIKAAQRAGVDLSAQPEVKPVEPKLEVKPAAKTESSAVNKSVEAAEQAAEETARRHHNAAFNPVEAVRQSWAGTEGKSLWRRVPQAVAAAGLSTSLSASLPGMFQSDVPLPQDVPAYVPKDFANQPDFGLGYEQVSVPVEGDAEFIGPVRTEIPMFEDEPNFANGGLMRRYDLGGVPQLPWQIKKPVFKPLEIKPWEGRDFSLNAGLSLYPEGTAPAAASPVTTEKQEKTTAGGVRPYSTLGRYAPMAFNAFGAIDNLLHDPDHYEFSFSRPSLPYGNLRLQRMSFDPVDVNMLTNAQLAQGNAALRSMRSMGPGSIAGTVALDSNLTGALGTGYLQGVQANQQGLSRAIAMNNDATAREAQYAAMLGAQRSGILNNMFLQDRQYNYGIARQNNAEEQLQFDAIGTNLGNLTDALAGNASENFAMNTIRSTYPYWIDKNGTVHYVNSASCGGFIKPYKR